jgi:hypothetical protein
MVKFATDVEPEILGDEKTREKLQQNYGRADLVRS